MKYPWLKFDTESKVLVEVHSLAEEVSLTPEPGRKVEELLRCVRIRRRRRSHRNSLRSIQTIGEGSMAEHYCEIFLLRVKRGAARD